MYCCSSLSVIIGFAGCYVLSVCLHVGHFFHHGHFKDVPVKDFLNVITVIYLNMPEVVDGCFTPETVIGLIRYSSNSGVFYYYYS
jgi:hypothetical protein